MTLGPRSLHCWIIFWTFFGSRFRRRVTIFFLDGFLKFITSFKLLFSREYWQHNGRRFVVITSFYFPTPSPTETSSGTQLTRTAFIAWHPRSQVNLCSPWGYFRNLWVGMVRLGPRKPQTKFSWVLLLCTWLYITPTIPPYPWIAILHLSTLSFL